MVRNNYSYWLDVTGPAEVCDAAEANIMGETELVKSESLAPESTMYEVDPKEGVMEEKSDMEDTIKRLSEKYPELKFSLKACNEDDRSSQRRIVYQAGSCLQELYSRTVDADDVYDERTVQDIVTFLKDKGFVNAAIQARLMVENARASVREVQQ